MKPLVVVASLSAFLAALVGAGLAAGSAHTPRNIVRIGILTSAYITWHNQTRGFRDGLAELGHIDGRDVVFHVFTGQGDSARLPALAADLVRLKPDLLYCVATPEARACQNATRTIPIIFTQTGDPVKLGLVQSLARPGGNITGIGSLRGMLAGKRLEVFKEVVPALRRVLVTYDPREDEEAEAVSVAKQAAAALGLTILDHPITHPHEIEAGLDRLTHRGRDGILIVQANPNLNIPGRSLEVATSYGIPTMYTSAFWAEHGALASYGANEFQQGRQAARLAHKILEGTSPAEIPVELPTEIEFVVNVRTAERLGLRVQPGVLLRADRVIQ
ncbi:MAG TPA: ABC transporter substrate-binding protein [Gemmatimonadales bacterium]|nr:ABC transporter substrate-binding protein [Gemmatimonadales bacterium]